MVGNMGQNDTTVTSVIRDKCVRVLLVICVILFSISSVNVFAATKGELSSRSSASTEISVTVPQTFNAVSPSELLLNKADSETFCVGHHGFSQNANVPYSLIVDDIITSDQTQQSHEKQTLAYDIYLQEKNSATDKQQLTPGMTIDMQSSKNIGKQLANECENTGLNLTLAENHSKKSGADGNNNLGLLVLLVSPN